MAGQFNRLFVKTGLDLLKRDPFIGGEHVNAAVTSDIDQYRPADDAVVSNVLRAAVFQPAVRRLVRRIRCTVRRRTRRGPERRTVAPREVELVLKNCPFVDDAIVVGAPDDRRGAILEAHVVPADESLTEVELLKYADPLLAEFKRPKKIVFRESFPRTNMGKVDRVGYYDTLSDDYM